MSRAQISKLKMSGNHSKFALWLTIIRHTHNKWSSFSNSLKLKVKSWSSLMKITIGWPQNLNKAKSVHGSPKSNCRPKRKVMKILSINTKPAVFLNVIRSDFLEFWIQINIEVNSECKVMPFKLILTTCLWLMGSSKRQIVISWVHSKSISMRIYFMGATLVNRAISTWSIIRETLRRYLILWVMMSWKSADWIKTCYANSANRGVYKSLYLVQLLIF